MYTIPSSKRRTLIQVVGAKTDRFNCLRPELRQEITCGRACWTLRDPQRTLRPDRLAPVRSKRSAILLAGSEGIWLGVRLVSLESRALRPNVYLIVSDTPVFALQIRGDLDHFCVGKPEAELSRIQRKGAEWDTHIARVTRFPNWDAMLKRGGTEWVKRKIGF